MLSVDGGLRKKSKPACRMSTEGYRPLAGIYRRSGARKRAPRGELEVTNDERRAAVNLLWANAAGRSWNWGVEGGDAGREELERLNELADSQAAIEENEWD